MIPDVPHHVTQRGNRREQVFFQDGDYRFYLKLISEAAKRSGTAIWAYCLMPNHVHFIMTPTKADGLRAAFAQAHRRYTSMIHARMKWTGHLWQGRFASTAMDEPHLYEAIRYVVLNPVRAGLVERASDWPWSSARAHLTGAGDGLVDIGPAAERIEDFAAYLDEEGEIAAVNALRRSRSTGRPVGAAEWLADLEARTRRPLAPRRRGPKPRAAATADQTELFSAVSP